MEYDKLFNWFSVLGGLLGGYLCQVFGGYDVIIKSLCCLVVLDYFTGLLKAVSKKTLSSEVGFKGLIKKTMIFIVVATSVIIQRIVGDSVPLRDITIIFFACNEAISLLENASEFVPIPKKLKDTLIQLRNETEDPGDSEEKEE